MKIGIGVTGCTRPEHVQTCVDEIKKHTQSDHKLVVMIDEKKKGVAWNKNQCLEALKDCDYVFLFDDDCFPRARGWETFFIEHSKRTGNQHFIYQHETLQVTQIKCVDDIAQYNNCNGCMMFFTRACLDGIGSFDESFGVYGFEHADMSVRANLSGFTQADFVCPIGASQYVYSLDLDNYIEYPIEHRPSLFPDEISQAVKVSRDRWVNKLNNELKPKKDEKDSD